MSGTDHLAEPGPQQKPPLTNPTIPTKHPSYRIPKSVAPFVCGSEDGRLRRLVIILIKLFT